MHFQLRGFLGLLAFALAAQPVAAAPALPPLTQWLPTNTLLVAELTRPRALLEPVLSVRVSEAVTTHPLYRALSGNPKFREFRGLVALLEGVAGTNWQAGLTSVTGGGVTLAVLGPNRVVLSIDAEEEKLPGKLHDFVKGMINLQASQSGRPTSVACTNIHDVPVWTFNGQEHHCLLGNRLLIGTSQEVLEEVLRRREAGPELGLASAPAFQAAKATAGSEAAAMIYLNLAALKQAPKLAPIFQGSRKAPLSALLFAGVLEALHRSNWAAADLQLQSGRLILRARLESQRSPGEDLARFAQSAEPGAGVLPNVSVPRQIAGLSFYRDLHRFYAAKDRLFPDRTSGLIFFENMMGIFFSGRDLTDEVLAQPQPDIRFVVAEQAYDPAVGTPETQFPAFAAVLRVRQPQQFDEVMEEAWQKALGLVNFTRGQQALPGLIIDRPTHNGTTFTAAHYSTTGLKDRTKLDSRFNVRPALAMPGDYLILSSTEQLARDLIDSLKHEQAAPLQPVANTDSLMEISGGRLASILEANRKAFIRQNMVKSGKTLEAAQQEVATLLTLAKAVSHLRLTLGTADQRAEARLEFALQAP